MRTVFLFWRNAHDLKSALFIRFEENLRPVSRIWEICRSKMRFGQNVLRMTWKERCTIFMESALFSRFDENFRPRWRFWELWRSKMRFGQNVLRMTWKERFCTIFMEKVHCFPVLTRILGQGDDFENFDAQKCDLAKTCCAWPEKRVLYNFLGKRNVFLFWRNAHDLKRASCKIFMEGALFSRFRKNFRPAWRFWELWRSKMRFGQNVLRMTWKERFVQFSWEKCTVFPFWREFQAKVTILRTLTLKNAIWPKRAAHDLKSGFCKIFLESALFFCFEEMRMTWKERLVQFSWKAHCFLVFERISGPRDDFENFDAPKCDLAKTCCAWPEKSVLYNFHEKRTVFPLWREFEASFTILRTLALKNKIWPKRAAHDLKRGFCTIFLQSALFFRFEENLRPVLRFSKLWFGQKVLRMTWKERFVQFALKAHCFLVLERIPGPRDDFENFHAQKYDLAKTCCAWPENSVFVIFSWKVHCFPVLTRISGQGDDF